MDTIRKLQELDHFTREQIVRDDEFSSIFPRPKFIADNTNEADKIFKVPTANDIYGYCLLVVGVLILADKVISYVF